MREELIREILDKALEQELGMAETYRDWETDRKSVV